MKKNISPLAGMTFIEVTIMKMNRRLIFAASLLFLSAGAFAQDTKPDPKFFVYLCFGQSNMEAGARPEAQDQGTLDPRFQMLAAPARQRTCGTPTGTG